MSKKLILLIGAPGAGKSTDAKLIEQRHQGEVTSYSTGDLLKAEIEKETGRGEIAKGFVSKGDLVPTQLVVELIIDAINHASTNVVIVDGFPLKAKQLQYFCDYLFTHNKIEITRVIEIKVDDALAKERWLSEGKSEEIFTHEMASYKASLSEIEAYYQGKGVLQIIDGSEAIETITAQIDAIVQEVL
jgi:adenylate kinase